MVHVQMGKKHSVDVADLRPSRLQLSQQVSFGSSEPLDYGAGIGGFSAQASVHQQRLAMRANQVALEMAAPAVPADVRLGIFFEIWFPGLSRNVGKRLDEGRRHFSVVQYSDFYISNSQRAVRHMLTP